MYEWFLSNATNISQQKNKVTSEIACKFGQAVQVHIQVFQKKTVTKNKRQNV